MIHLIRLCLMGYWFLTSARIIAWQMFHYDIPGLSWTLGEGARNFALMVAITSLYFLTFTVFEEEA